MTKKWLKTRVKTVNGTKIYHILSMTKLSPGNSSALKLAEISKGGKVALYACPVKHQVLAFVRHWKIRSFIWPSITAMVC